MPVEHAKELLSGGRHPGLLRIECALLVIAVLSPLWVIPLSTPVFSDVVVVMHHDSAVNTAARTVTENVLDVQVVEYGSLEYALTIHRMLGRVVWVFHSRGDEILVGKQAISWSAFSTRTETSPGKDIVLACESGEMNKYVPLSQDIGIRSAMDATLGGLLAVYLLEPSEVVLNSIFERISGLLSGQVLPEFLAPFDVQIASWLGWTGLHRTVMVNLLDLLLYACPAIVVVVFGTIWDGIGVMLDSFNISLGGVLLDWIWPVLIKPFLLVLLVGMTGALGSVIAAISSALRAMVTLSIVTSLSSALM